MSRILATLSNLINSQKRSHFAQYGERSPLSLQQQNTQTLDRN
ncbi:MULTISPECIES: hypothetical protein [unclassified Dolichospermum]|nr:MULTISPECIES: hypothetical protein [unclassified Dolichospermum]